VRAPPPNLIDVPWRLLPGSRLAQAVAITPGGERNSHSARTSGRHTNDERSTPPGAYHAYALVPPAQASGRRGAKGQLDRDVASETLSMPAFCSVVSVLVRFVVRSFSTNSRPALRAAACGGRPRAGGDTAVTGKRASPSPPGQATAATTAPAQAHLGSQPTSDHTDPAAPRHHQGQTDEKRHRHRRHPLVRLRLDRQRPREHPSATQPSRQPQALLRSAWAGRPVLGRPVLRRWNRRSR
jgi:hypothetical protein